MATAQQVINSAGGLLRIVDSPGADVESSLSADMFTALQNWIAEMAEDGALEIPAPSALTDDLDVPPGTIRALVYNLAVEYGEQVGKNVMPKVESIAKQTRDRLLARSTLSKQIDLGADGLMVSHGTYNIRNG